jgi:putative integral membrane protein (TIGR02587 family)
VSSVQTASGIPRDERSPNQAFAIGLARAFGGAILFSLPILMTMEMWQLGAYMSSARLGILLVVTLPLLIGLSHYLGFEETFGLKDDAVDAFVAVAVGFAASTAVLTLFAVIKPGMSHQEIIGDIAIQTVPASIGAMFAQSELGTPRAEKKNRHAGYCGKLFIMAAGALFLGFNVAPTEEMVLIAHKMSAGHAIILALASLLIMHAFVYAVEFRGQVALQPDTPFWTVALRYTVVGYAIALLISLYVLWTFGRTDGMHIAPMAQAMIVLGCPAAVGAAAARLIL